MKIVVAMDSFKGSLTARLACEAVKKGLLSVLPAAEIIIRPMADGGEGTAKALISAKDGRWVEKNVTGPLPNMTVKAGYAWFANYRSALVEMASASGLPLLTESQRNPLETTTYGTGELIKAAAQKNPEKIFLAVGGSATVDGGVGAAMALGWRFLDKKGDAIALGGGNLSRIQKILPPPELGLPVVEVLCDVQNPLCGPQGAARVYGPQKGATPQMVGHLEKGLDHLCTLVGSSLGKDIDIPGAGAAGGLAAGAVAFMNAKLVSGIDTIIECTDLAQQIATSQWVITGEGRFDSQSLHGKVVKGVTKIAGQAGVPVGVLAGSVNLSSEEYQSLGIVDAISAKKDEISLEYAIAHGDELLIEAAAEFARENLITPRKDN
ncbi:MAG: glycerate kinase [Planctomycetes bacterium]|nr:glycerate kinase [Planctomycetota bacterium]